MRVGYGMISREEISLVITNIKKTYGNIWGEVYVDLILVVLITKMLPPLVEDELPE
jgi:Kef-type K+ transport system membrane component KefB